MTWIRTIPFPEADDALRTAVEGQRALYPAEYAVSAFPDQVPGTGIVDSHSLIPDALFHAFATFGHSPDHSHCLLVQLHQSRR
ncbi:MAG: hypothetical protein QOC81_3328 [Thermoanaerobaculia bacterium]|jgi:hypothetical protein|nr:hypothetical protein [Thermoanaerobaculia bacterium]